MSELGPSPVVWAKFGVNMKSTFGVPRTSHVPAPSKRSPLEAFVDLKVAGGDLLEGPGS